jgi:hypothetical protein
MVLSHVGIGEVARRPSEHQNRGITFRSHIGRGAIDNDSTFDNEMRVAQADAP